MATNITGNQDGENGGNDTYTIRGRGVVTRQCLVDEVEAGRHPNHHVIDVGGEQFIRANPDCSQGNNVNK